MTDPGNFTEVIFCSRLRDAVLRRKVKRVSVTIILINVHSAIVTLFRLLMYTVTYLK